MSGVAGIYARAGQAVEDSVLQRMLASIVHRGPDAARLWNDGSAGLVHCMLHATPESLFETQPFADGALCITADARIDNRAELARLLGFDARDLPVTPDSALILAAYRKWGKTCPAHLLGDFAFAIWDAGQRALFLARDPFGVKPLYYTITQNSLLFGSEIKAILCSGLVPAAINEPWLANFLLPRSDLLDKESTFYQGILRLTPAHTLTVTPDGHALDCYWRLDPERETRYAREEEYAEALRERFTRAVQTRLRSVFPVGSTLSGGLDSSSIACTARNLLQESRRAPLHTFSAVFTDSPDADESPYIHAVIDQGGVVPHLLHPDQTSPFIDLERVVWHLDEPFYGTNYFMPWAFYRSAQEHGVRVMLDGTDGDTTISHGLDHFDVLAQRGDWQQFAREAKAVTKNFDHPRYASSSMILRSFAAPRVMDMARRGRYLDFSRSVSELSRLFGLSRRRLLLGWGVKPLLPRPVLAAAARLRGRGRANGGLPPYINEGFARRLLAGRPRNAPAAPGLLPLNSGRAIHYQFLTNGMLPYTLEMINRFGAAFSVDMRFPFCDRELVEFALSLPPELKLKDGWSRYIMRKAMTGILPEKVQWRGGKISLGKVYPTMLRRYARDYVEGVLAQPPDPLPEYFNLPVIRKMYDAFLHQNNTEDLQWVWQAVVFAVWFKQVEFY